jgi:y4mF family transcriptional regulator
MSGKKSPSPRSIHPIGDFIRERRKANRLTQRALAELAGVGTRLISELERGKPTVRLDGVDQVLRVFGKKVGIVDLPAGERQYDN